MGKTFSVFINFAGNCREALAFYAKVFQAEVMHLMPYSDMPPDPNFPLSDADQDRVMYASIPIFGCNVMFCDIPSSMGLDVGDNISPTLGSDDEAELLRVFAELGEGGEVLMPPEKTQWSKLYGMVQDKYGVIWQISHEDGMA